MEILRLSNNTKLSKKLNRAVKNGILSISKAEEILRNKGVADVKREKVKRIVRESQRRRGSSRPASSVKMRDDTGHGQRLMDSAVISAAGERDGWWKSGSLGRSRSPQFFIGKLSDEKSAEFAIEELKTHYDDAKEGKIRQFLNPIFGYISSDGFSSRSIKRMDVDFRGGFQKLDEDNVWTGWSEQFRDETTLFLDSLNKSKPVNDPAVSMEMVLELIEGHTVAIQELKQKQAAGNIKKTKGSQPERRKGQWDHVVNYAFKMQQKTPKVKPNEILTSYKKRFRKRPQPTTTQLSDTMRKRIERYGSEAFQNGK